MRPGLTTRGLGATLTLLALSACHAPFSAAQGTPRPEPAIQDPAGEQEGGVHDEHGHGESEHSHDALPEPLGFDLGSGWLDPWVHKHFNRRGTPYVHTFALEPAFIDRDLFLDAGFASGPSGDETELVAELEWGLTRRLGVALELPYVRTSPDGGPSESGIGDVVVAPRALLVETDRFLAAVNLGLAIPSGDDDRGLGDGEASLAPSMSFWFDLGHRVQAHLQAGTSTGLDSGNDELFYGVAGAWTFEGPTPFHRGSSSFVEGHFDPGTTSAILEFVGRTVLDGPGDGTTTNEVLGGLSYVLTGAWELRGAYRTSVSGPGDFDDGFILSAIVHF